MNMAEKYVRVTRTINNKGKLVPLELVSTTIKDDGLDYYQSTYYYNEEHFKQFQETKSVEGIKDVKTDKLWFDFDSKDNLELARKDTVELVNRLKQLNITPEKLEIYFSGNKGFNVILNLSREITPQQVKHLVINKFGKGLNTLDVQIYNPSRILRIPRTKHQESGLYKIPLTFNQLENWTLDQIKENAAKNQVLGMFTPERVELSDDMFELEEVKREIKETTTDSFNLRNRPKGWKTSKWALVQGEMQRGERDTGCLIILATCKSLGYDMITAYYLAKGALKRAHEKYGEGSFTKELLWEKAKRVYSDEWQGGTFTVETEPVLQKLCDRLGIRDEASKALTVGSDQLFDKTLDFAENIDELTIKTGIEPLDNKLRMTVGMSVALVAAPGAGKTSVALQILHNMSKMGQQCLFFSYDMYAELVGIKIIQKHKNKSFEDVLKLLKENKGEFRKQAEEVMKTEYANVEFCFQSGQTIDDIQETIKYVIEKKGKPIRFVVFDYNELVMTEYSDPTQSSAFTSQKIRQIANEFNLCAFSLFQPSKITGTPADEIKSYRNIKGSSAIEQSAGIILSISRPGCDPELSEKGWDQFAVVNCLKNRFGGLFRLELEWNGVQGAIRKFSGEGYQKFLELKELIQQNKESKNDRW